MLITGGAARPGRVGLEHLHVTGEHHQLVCPLAPAGPTGRRFALPPGWPQKIGRYGPKRAPNVSAKRAWKVGIGWSTNQRHLASAGTGLGLRQSRSTRQWSCLAHKDRHPGQGNQEVEAWPSAAESLPAGPSAAGAIRPSRGKAETLKLAIRLRLRRDRPQHRCGVFGMGGCCPPLAATQPGERTDQDLAGSGQINWRIARWGAHSPHSARQSGIVPARSRPKVRPTVSDALLAALLKRSPFLCLAVVLSFAFTALLAAPGQSPHGSARGSGDDPAPGRRFPCRQRPGCPSWPSCCERTQLGVHPQLGSHGPIAGKWGASMLYINQRLLPRRPPPRQQVGPARLKGALAELERVGPPPGRRAFAARPYIKGPAGFGQLLGRKCCTPTASPERVGAIGWHGDPRQPFATVTACWSSAPHRRPGRPVWKACSRLGYAVTTRGPGSSPGPSPAGQRAHAASEVFMGHVFHRPPGGRAWRLRQQSLDLWRRCVGGSGRPRPAPVVPGRLFAAAATSTKGRKVACNGLGAQRTQQAGLPLEPLVQAAAAAPDTIAACGRLVRLFSPRGRASWIRLKAMRAFRSDLAQRRGLELRHGWPWSAWGASPGADWQGGAGGGENP